MRPTEKSLRNLKPWSERPPEERRAYGSKGGKASGKKRAAAAAMRKKWRQIVRARLEQWAEPEAVYLECLYGMHKLLRDCGYIPDPEKDG